MYFILLSHEERFCSVNNLPFFSSEVANLVSILKQDILESTLTSEIKF
jgi:hypothetical protein